jgi:hypothetical protein
MAHQRRTYDIAQADGPGFLDTCRAADQQATAHEIFK